MSIATGTAISTVVRSEPRQDCEGRCGLPDPPFNGMPDGAGLDIELMTALAEKLGEPRRIHPVRRHRLRRHLRRARHRRTTASPPARPSPPNAQQKANFLPPYLISGQSLAVDTTRLPHVTLDRRPRRPHDRRAAGQHQPADRATTGRRGQGRSRPRLRLRRHPATALTDLTTGACDAFMKLAPVLTELVDADSRASRSCSAGISVEDIAIAVGLRRPGAAGPHHVAQEQLEDDGTLQQIRRKWLGNPYADQSLAVH